MDYIINNYRTRKIDDKYFVTTDHGSYCILSEDEFKKLKQNNIDPPYNEMLDIHSAQVIETLYQEHKKKNK